MRYKRAIHDFIRAGEHDPSHAAWPGDIVQRCRQADLDLRSALVHEVQRRSTGASHPSFADVDYREFTRRKVEPMVRGLFAGKEQEPVLSTLEKSVVFLTGNNIESVILNSPFLHTAWVLANLYLGSIGAELLGPEAPNIVGLSEETTCYVSTRYFHEQDRFADYLVHEAAHVFHNGKRRTLGLCETRRKEWLLNIDFRKREQFAYACEFYSRILELSSGFKDRQRLFVEFRARAAMSHAELEWGELIDTLNEAIVARNGWKRILARCSPA